MLSGYLKEQLGLKVNCEHTVTASNQYSSFKISAECDDVIEVVQPGAGNLVSYGPRKMWVKGTTESRGKMSAAPAHTS